MIQLTTQIEKSYQKSRKFDSPSKISFCFLIPRPFSWWLDLDACIWLSEYLATSWQGTLLIVSHDAEFLDEVCTDVLHLDDEKLRHYQVSWHYWYILHTSCRVLSWVNKIAMMLSIFLELALDNIVSLLIPRVFMVASYTHTFTGKRVSIWLDARPSVVFERARLEAARKDDQGPDGQGSNEAQSRERSSGQAKRLLER